MDEERFKQISQLVSELPSKEDLVLINRENEREIIESLTENVSVH